MPATMQIENEVCHIRIECDMTIYTALELKRHLMISLGAAPQIELDLSGVSELDSAGLQLLLLLKREAAKRGTQLLLKAHTPAVTDVIDTFNLAAHFGDPIVLPDRRAAGPARCLNPISRRKRTRQ
jgi:anti-anti-sigma factor